MMCGNDYSVCCLDDTANEYEKQYNEWIIQEVKKETRRFIAYMVISVIGIISLQ